MSESGGGRSPAPRPVRHRAGTGGAKTLSEAVEAYLTDGKERRGWQPKTFDESARVLAWFVQMVGGEKALGQITREDCRSFEDALSKVAARLPKDAKLRLEVDRAGKTRERLSATAQAKYPGRVGSFFHFGVGEGWIDKSPMRLLKRANGARGGANIYEPFDDEELARIFSAEFRRRAAGGGGKAVPEVARYWLPLIALYTGAQLGEVAQLRACDVREVDEVWAFEFTGRGEGQSLKTVSSRRVVPMHSQLVELGFREFVERRGRTASKQGQLFREVERTRNGSGTKESHWFRRWVDAVGIRDPRKVIHSFRHTVSYRLKRLGVEQYLIESILGHANETMSTGRYGGALEAGDLESRWWSGWTSGAARGAARPTAREVRRYGMLRDSGLPLRVLATFAAVVVASACSASRTSTVRVLPGRAVTQSAKVLVLEVPDGPRGHLGAGTTAALRDSLASHGVSPFVSDAGGLQPAFEEATSLGCQYVLRAEVTHWEDRLTYMSNRPDKATLSIELYEVSSRELVASGTHAVTGAIEEYVDRHPERFVPEMADGSLARIFGWPQTVFAEE